MLCVAMTATHPSFVLHGPAEPRTPLVLDSPHSGVDFPGRFRRRGRASSTLRDGEDCYVDELWQPATERGVGLLAASVPRTYIDYNRHAGDIDLELVEGGQWPYEYLPSGKARLGKALIWRTLDDGTPIYARRLGGRGDPPADRALSPPLPPRAGQADRSDACAVRRELAHRLPLDERGRRRAGRRRRRQGARRHRPRRPRRHDLRRRPSPSSSGRISRPRGYDVKVNDPYKGVELVRAYSNPAERRMSLQLEVNKRLYMDEKTLQKTAGFATLQRDLDVAASTRCSRTAAQAKRSRSHANGSPRSSRHGQARSSSSAARVGRCRRARSRSTGRRVGATRSPSPTAAGGDRGGQHGRWMRGEIPAPGGAEPPSAAEIRTALAGRDLACWCPADRAVSRRPAAAHRQRRLDALARRAGIDPRPQECEQFAFMMRRPHAAPSRPTAMPAPRRLLASLALLALATPLAQAQGVVNIYSARHYQTDEAFYANFTKETGIKINRIDGREDELLRADQERRREQPGRHPDHRRRVAPGDRRQGRAVPAGAVEGARGAHPGAPAHAELAGVLDPRAGHRLQQGRDQPRLGAELRRPRRSAPEGQICVRSGSHPYNLSLGAALIAHDGEAKTEQWAQGPGRQLRARAQGRRHRPAARPSPPASAASRWPTATTWRG